MQKQINFIYGLILSILGCSLAASGSEVYYAAEPGLKYVNMGPVFVGDSIFSTFTLQNSSAEDYSILPVAPSLVIYATPTATTPDEFLLFRNVSPALPAKVRAQTKQNLTMRFIADTNATEPFGRKEAGLRLGLVRPSDSTIVVADTFMLVAKKTKLQIDGYEDAISFDSVYINPSLAPEVQWLVKSVFRDNLKVESQTLTYSSVKLFDEITFEEFPSVLFAKKYQTNPWKIRYSPKDDKPDTALFKLRYKPAPEIAPDSTEFCQVRISGVGVRQKLVISNTNSPFTISGDTLELGALAIGNEVPIELHITNQGNMPFGSVKTALIPAMGSAVGFKITKEFLQGEPNLKPGKTSKIFLTAKPETRGAFLIKCELTSDIFNRKGIKSAPLSAEKVTFYLKGEATTAIPVLPFDTLDFGNVFNYYPYCNEDADSVIVIRNGGDRELIITDIKIFKGVEEVTYFDFSKKTLKLKPKTSDTVTVHFYTQGSAEYNAYALIFTNAPHPFDTLRLNLRAASVRPVITSIYMDSVYSAPGNIVSVAIRIDSAARFASNFTDTLFYDRTILEYSDYINAGTASDGPIFPPEINELAGGGRLAINLSKPPGSRFYAKDTLIILRFKTYLGEAVGTSISFLEPRFGNERCSNVLFIDKESIHSGWYGIDSVCGLDRKAYKRDNGLFSFEEISPNPASNNITLKFETAFKTNVKISIYNEYGEEVSRIADEEMSKGVHELTGQISQLSRGLYYCILSAGNYRANRKFIKTE